MTAFRELPASPFSARPVRHAVLGEAGPAGKAQHHDSRDRGRDSAAEHGQPCRPDRRRASASRSEVHVCHQSAGTLETEEEFGKIVLRANVDGSLVRLKDVARVELGSQTYAMSGRLNGKPSAVLALYQLPGTNAIAAVDGVKKLMKDAERSFPPDRSMRFPSTPLLRSVRGSKRS